MREGELMSLMDIIFGAPPEEEEVRNEAGVILKPVQVLNAKGEKIATVTAGDILEIVQEKELGQIRLVQKNSKGNEIKTLMTCPYAQNADARKELTDMMTAVQKDIENVYETGKESIRIPESKYELFVYMRRRPTVPMDMEKLSRELSSGEARENVKLFRSFMEKNPRINIYAAVYSLATDTAYRILKTEYRQFSNIHFIQLDNSDRKPITWDHAQIKDSLEDTPNVCSIGIGIRHGDKPRYAIELTNEDISSVVKKAALLSHHNFNIREEMIDAQAEGHAKGMWDLGIKKGKSEDFIRKTVEDLALEDACYRIPEKAVKEIIMKAKQRGFNEGEEIGLIRVPVLDRTLLLNLFKQADDGFLVKEEAGGYQYYRDVTGKLVIKYGWTKEKSWYIAPMDKEEKEIRAEAAQVMLEGKYIRALQKLLRGNRNRSVADSFGSLKEFIQSYQQMGIDMDEQMDIIESARESFPDENIEELQTVIQEVLSPHSVYDNFGF